MSVQASRRPTARGSAIGPREATVVVGYDGSAAARRAARWASLRAGPSGGLVLVHAAAPSRCWRASDAVSECLRDASGERGDAVLDEARQNLRSRRVDGWVVEAEPAAALRDAARAVNAAEIAVGSRGLSCLERGLGTTPRALLRAPERPLVIVPPGARLEGRGSLRHVVVVVTAQLEQPWLSDAAVRLARPSGARIVVLGVDKACDGGAIELTPRAYRAEGQAAAQRAAARLGSDGLSAVEVAVRSGDPAIEAETLAHRVGAEAIVVGWTRESHGAGRLLGSPAAALIERSARAIVVVPSTLT